MMTIPTLKRTTKDAANLMTVSAFGYLAQNNQARAQYSRLIGEYIEQYGAPDGWPYKWVSGCINQAWPEFVKERMRLLARSFVQHEDNAYAAWRAAGRQRRTLRPYVEQSRIVERWNGTIPEFSDVKGA